MLNRLLLSLIIAFFSLFDVYSKTNSSDEVGITIITKESYVTPIQFGAKGDGKTDDTKALREAIHYSSKNGKILFFPSGKSFKIKGALNYYNGNYESLTINILGTLPSGKGSYTPGVNGGIIVEKGICVFKDATISGSIEKTCITGKRDESVHFFDNCTCTNLNITGCNISNFGAIFYDTTINRVSQITYNTFLTAFYFAVCRMRIVTFSSSVNAA